MIEGSYFSNNTKVANLIRKNNLPLEEEIPIIVEKDKQTKDPIIVTLLISNNLSNFDMDVADAIYTMYKEKIVTITPSGVLRVLSGDARQAAKKGYNKELIVESIDKLGNTIIDIECSEQMKRRKEPIEYIGGYPFLNVVKSEQGEKYYIKQYGEKDKVDKTTYYEEKFFMPLYGYMEILKQVIAFPQVLLDSSSVSDGMRMNNSIENIQIKRYLIRRLEIKRRRIKDKKDEELIEKIVYYYPSHKKGGGEGGLFSFLNLRETDFAKGGSWKHKRQNVHNKVMQILTIYKKMGYIQDVEVYKANRGMFYGVIIKGPIENPYEIEKK